MAENNEAPWRMEVPAEVVAENLGAFYVWFDDEAVVVEPAMPELVGAQ